MEKNIKIILTTRHYPIHKEWECHRQLEINTEWLDFNNNKEKKKAFNGRRKRVFEPFTVFVVPCVDVNNETITMDQQREYLNDVIGLVLENGDDYYNVFLVAHDGDYGVHGVEGDYVEMSQVSGGSSHCPRLLELVKIKHAYMFQHGDNKKIGNIVKKLDDNSFDKIMCTRLYNLVFGEREMLDFFVKVNADRQSYPESL